MKLVDRILARTLIALTVLALVALPASGSAGVSSISGAAVCCAGVVADADSSQSGSAGVELPAGDPCATGCSGAFVVYPPSCGAHLRHPTLHVGGVWLTGHDTQPDPHPPKISAVA